MYLHYYNNEAKFLSRSNLAPTNMSYFVNFYDMPCLYLGSRVEHTTNLKMYRLSTHVISCHHSLTPPFSPLDNNNNLLTTLLLLSIPTIFILYSVYTKSMYTILSTTCPLQVLPHQSVTNLGRPAMTLSNVHYHTQLGPSQKCLLPVT